MPVLRTSYEINYPDRAFYSVERTGYVTVGELLYQLVNDLLYTGAYARPEEVGTVFYKEDNSGSTVIGSWPISERLYTLANRGTGYSVNDFLVMADSDSTPVRRFAIQVKTVDPVDGGITKYQAFAGPRYNTVSTIQPVPMLYSKTTGPLSPIPAVTDRVGTEDLDASNGQFIARQGVINSKGDRPIVRTIGQIIRGQSGTWGQNWSSKTLGYGPLGEGGPLGSTWPTNPGVIWCFNDEISGNVKVGQEVFLNSVSSNASSLIGSGITITKIEKFAVISGSSGTNYPVSEVLTDSKGARIYTLTNATTFFLSNTVSLGQGENIYVRGMGAKFFNNETAVPKEWSVILETKGAGDALSDGEPVLANVYSSSGNALIVNNMTTRNPWKPQIYPGQRLTNQSTTGSVTGYVYVKDIIKSNVAWTSMSLTSNQTIPAGEGIKFTWDTLQPYRLKFVVGGPQVADIYAGTDLQIPVGGKFSYIWNEAGTAIVDIAGLIGARPTKPGLPLINDIGVATSIPTVLPDPLKITEGFINRTIRIGGNADPTKFQGNPESYPINYTLTISQRGIFFGIWESNWSVIQKRKTAGDVYFNWVLIQRPVDRVTGRILTSGRCPVFCINSVGSKYWKFIVRESDILHPTVGDPDLKYYKYDEITQKVILANSSYRTPADYHSQDSFAILNTQNQIALTEDSKFLISFLHNLTTPRFRYSEELDMIGQTSADVCMATNDISIQAYKESGLRTYRAMAANNEYNTGLRIAVLKDLAPYVDEPVI
jgi:hypothetical protein